MLNVWTERLEVRAGLNRVPGRHKFDQTIQQLRGKIGENEDTVALAEHYHSLLRTWSVIYAPSDSVATGALHNH